MTLPVDEEVRLPQAGAAAPVRAKRAVDWVGDAVLVMAAGAWIYIFGSILRHRIYVSHDSLISYAHSWYVAERLWHGHGIPVRMPIVGHGSGFAFPYGVVPWTVAAILHPLFGDWSTTFVLVAATAGVMAATFWAFPELRRGWWAVAVLVEPAMVSSPIIGQIPFLAGSALLLVAIGAWRRHRDVLAFVAAGLAQLTHPAVLVPLAAILVAGAFRWQVRRRTLLRLYAASLCVAIPGVIVMLVSPVFQETSLATKFIAFVGTIAPRSLLFLVPMALVLLRRYASPLLAPVVVAALIAANALMWAPLGMRWAWRALHRRPDGRMVTFIDGPDFAPGATYRVLRLADGKVGMYQLLRAGARLDSEFFPESIDYRSWPSTAQYSTFLSHRHVDFVMLWHGYDRKFHTNEHALLDGMATTGCSGGIRITSVRRVHDYDLYAVDRRCGPVPSVTGNGG